MPEPEKIPANVDASAPTLSQGRITYDMKVNALDTDSIQRCVIDRIPQTVKDQLVGFAGQARMVIEIYQSGG